MSSKNKDMLILESLVISASILLSLQNSTLGTADITLGSYYYVWILST